MDIGCARTSIVKPDGQASYKSGLVTAATRKNSQVIALSLTSGTKLTRLKLTEVHAVHTPCF